MFLFLILLIPYWVVAPSLVAELTNVGVTFFVADTTSMCGVGSDGAAALLSAYPPRFTKAYRYTNCGLQRETSRVHFQVVTPNSIGSVNCRW